MPSDYVQDPLKLEAVLNSISIEYTRQKEIARPHGLTRGVFHKLCYLIDFEFYRLYGRSMSGETYVHTRNGPIPIHFNRTINELITDRRLETSDDSFSSMVLNERTFIKVKAKTVDDRLSLESEYDPELEDIAYHNIPELTDEENDVIRMIVRKYGNMTARELEPIVKSDPAWILSSEGQAMDYRLVFYRKDVQDEIAKEQGDD